MNSTLRNHPYLSFNEFFMSYRYEANICFRKSRGKWERDEDEGLFRSKISKVYLAYFWNRHLDNYLGLHLHLYNFLSLSPKGWLPPSKDRNIDDAINLTALSIVVFRISYGLLHVLQLRESRVQSIPW